MKKSQFIQTQLSIAQELWRDRSKDALAKCNEHAQSLQRWKEFLEKFTPLINGDTTKDKLQDINSTLKFYREKGVIGKK